MLHGKKPCELVQVADGMDTAPSCRCVHVLGHSLTTTSVTGAGLHHELEMKEIEKQQLMMMCDELMKRLERAGLAA